MILGPICNAGETYYAIYSTQPTLTTPGLRDTAYLETRVTRLILETPGRRLKDDIMDADAVYIGTRRTPNKIIHDTAHIMRHALRRILDAPSRRAEDDTHNADTARYSDADAL